jgi:hypothetical protein
VADADDNCAAVVSPDQGEPTTATVMPVTTTIATVSSTAWTRSYSTLLDVQEAADAPKTLRPDRSPNGRARRVWRCDQFDLRRTRTATSDELGWNAVTYALVGTGKALNRAGGREGFDRLAPSHRKEHVRAISEAKQPETRARRIT